MVARSRRPKTLRRSSGHLGGEWHKAEDIRERVTAFRRYGGDSVDMRKKTEVVKELIELTAYAENRMIGAWWTHKTAAPSVLRWCSR